MHQLQAAVTPFEISEAPIKEYPPEHNSSNRQMKTWRLSPARKKSLLNQSGEKSMRIADLIEYSKERHQIRQLRALTAHFLGHYRRSGTNDTDKNCIRL
ncbi:MAG: hypothetical protein ACXV9U_00175 [Methylobacter sp.]